jgi:hypothetical protein
VPYIVFDLAAAQAAPATTIGAPKISTGDTLASMRVWLQRALGGRDDLPTSRIDEWINDAYLDVCTSLDIDEMKGSLAITTTTGQAMYRLPAVVSSTQGAALTDSTLNNGGQPLSKVDKSAYRDWSNQSGRPEHYFREGELVILYPTPDKAYSVVLDIRIRPVILTLDTHSPILGQEWHRPIRLTARQMAFDDLQEFDKAAPAENSAISSIRRRNDREATEDERRVVGSSVPGRGRRPNRYLGRD